MIEKPKFKNFLKANFVRVINLGSRQKIVYYALQNIPVFKRSKI